jgi:glycosyltransferase involved in cell wall biosynthesis
MPQTMTKPPFPAKAEAPGDDAASREGSTPAVSVLITLYNYAAYIEGCLDSVRASKTEGLPGGIEVIVVDDGSTDSSVAVVESYMSRHPFPIRLIKNVINRGLCDTRNIGLRAARAPFVFILDADNEIRPECLPAHYQALASSDYAVAYGHVNRFDHATRRDLSLLSQREWNVRDLVARPYIDAMSLVRKESVLRVGGYSIEYGTIMPQGWEDYDLWLKLAQAGYSGVMIPQILSDYRVHPSSMLHKTTAPFQYDFAAYFTRKFHALIQQHPDTPTLFGVSRQELAMNIKPGGWLKPVSKDRPPPGVLHRLLGRKLRRSLSKRLAALYHWLDP